MLRDIQHCSIQYLHSVFEPLDQYKNFVLWIRNAEMTRQIYLSGNYVDIWDRDPAVVYELPLLWFDYLAQEQKPLFMQSFQERHYKGYERIEENHVLYQIHRPDSTLRYMHSQCFKVIDPKQRCYVAGFCEMSTASVWQTLYSAQQCKVKEEHRNIKVQFLNLLQHHFGIIELPDRAINEVDADHLRFIISHHHRIHLSKREAECLYYTCLGMTTKEVARVMGDISPRTVETHVDSIRNKTDLATKSQLISAFSRYCNRLEVN